MDLRNKLSHMQGMSVKVNGTRYHIGADGVARDVQDEDAKKLLQNDAWSVYTQRSPVPGKAVEKPSMPAPEPPQAAPKPEKDPEPPAEPEEALEPSEAPEEPESEEPEWPDPDMSMTKAYLQEMADAYDVEYDAKVTKQDLIDAILAVMYPDD